MFNYRIGLVVLTNVLWVRWNVTGAGWNVTGAEICEAYKLRKG
jgi:hypothetical protein